MWYHACGFILTLIEMLSVILYFETFLDDKKVDYKIGKFKFSVALSLIVYIYKILLTDLFVLYTITLTFVLVVVFKFYYNEKFKKVIVLSVLYVGILITIDFAASAFIYAVFFNNMIIKDYTDLLFILISMLSRTFLLICILLIKSVLSLKNTELRSGMEWLRFMLFPAFALVVIMIIISSVTYIDNEQIANILFMIALGMTGLNIMAFYLINDIAERESRMYQSKLTQTQLQNDLKIYQTIADSYDNQKKQVHEFKNQIMCIGYLLNDGDYNEAQKYVNKINNSLVGEINCVDTNNVIVNAVINSKYREASDKNIVFTFKINDLAGIKLEDKDIVAILSNLLNNAIEAAEKCTQNRKIKLKINQNEQELIIAVNNTYSEELLVENGEYKTTKTDEVQVHGIGIKNIIKAVKKYDGEYLIDNEDGEFNFMIIIPN